MRCTTVTGQPCDGDPARGLEAEQAAADHGGARCAPAARGRGSPRSPPGRGTGARPARSMPGIGGMQRLRAGRERQRVVGERPSPSVEPDGALAGSGPRRPSGRAARSTRVVVEPLRRAQLRACPPILARDEDLRQPDAVVGEPRLAADQRDRRCRASRSRSASQTAWPAIPPPIDDDAGRARCWSHAPMVAPAVSRSWSVCVSGR